MPDAFISARFAFDAKNKEAQRIAARRAGELIQGVSVSTKLAVRELITRSIRDGIPPYDAARMIEGMIGLNSQQMNAAYNLRTKLINSGLNITQVERRVTRYQAKALRERGRTIARTEIMSSLNAGAEESWVQAQGTGALPKEAMKEWIITPVEACQICRPLDGQQVPISAAFQSIVGPIIRPTAHPRCRCAIAPVPGPFAPRAQTAPPAINIGLGSETKAQAGRALRELGEKRAAAERLRRFNIKSPLSTAEGEAVKRFTESGYDYSFAYVQQYLRDVKAGTVPKFAMRMVEREMKKRIKLIDSAIKKGVASHTSGRNVVYRGTGYKEYGIKRTYVKKPAKHPGFPAERHWAPPDLKVGQILENPQYQSVTTSQKIARESFSIPGSGDPVMRIFLKEGDNILDVKKFAAIAEEEELILGRNIQLRITKLVKDRTGKVQFVDVEIVPKKIPVKKVKVINKDAKKGVTGQPIEETRSLKIAGGADDDLLVRGKVIKQEEIAVGTSSETIKITVRDPKTGEKSMGIFKPISGEGMKGWGGGYIRDTITNKSFPLGEREVFAQVVDRRLGTNMIPTTRMREVPGKGKGSVQKFVKDSETAADAGRSTANVEDAQRQFILDMVLGNTDRHTGNYMITAKHGNVVSIDNGLTFPASSEIRWITSRSGRGGYASDNLGLKQFRQVEVDIMQRIPVDDKLRLQIIHNIDATDWEKLARGTNMNPAERDAFLARVKWTRETLEKNNFKEVFKQFSEFGGWLDLESIPGATGMAPK